MIYMSDTQLHLGSYIILTFLDSSASRAPSCKNFLTGDPGVVCCHSKPRNAMEPLKIDYFMSSSIHSILGHPMILFESRFSDVLSVMSLEHEGCLINDRV